MTSSVYYSSGVHCDVRQLWLPNTPVHACNVCLLCNWLEQSVQSCKGMHGVGAGDLYLAAMDAIYAVNPNVLFFIEGTGQSGLANNWGDGLCTDASTISSYGISDPNPFFTTLMGKAYLAQVCICLFYHCLLCLSSPVHASCSVYQCASLSICKVQIKHG